MKGWVRQFGNEGWMDNFLRHKSALIVGSGPSIRGFDFDAWRRPDVAFFVINHTAKLIRPDVFVALEQNVIMHLRDEMGWDFHEGRVKPPIKLNGKFPKEQQITGIWGRFRTIVGPSVALRPGGMITVLADNSDGFRNLNLSTGAFALNYALMMGADHVFLIGHDGAVKETHADSRPVHRGGLAPEQAVKYQNMNPAWQNFRKHHRVRNLSKISLLDHFTKCSPEEGLKMLDDTKERHILETARLSGETKMSTTT